MSCNWLYPQYCLFFTVELQRIFERMCVRRSFTPVKHGSWSLFSCHGLAQLYHTRILSLPISLVKKCGSWLRNVVCHAIKSAQYHMSVKSSDCQMHIVGTIIRLMYNLDIMPLVCSWFRSDRWVPICSSWMSLRSRTWRCRLTQSPPLWPESPAACSLPVRQHLSSAVSWSRPLAWCSPSVDCSFTPYLEWRVPIIASQLHFHGVESCMGRDTWSCQNWTPEKVGKTFFHKIRTATRKERNWHISDAALANEV